MGIISHRNNVATHEEARAAALSVRPSTAGFSYTQNEYKQYCQCHFVLFAVAEFAYHTAAVMSESMDCPRTR